MRQKDAFWAPGSAGCIELHGNLIGAHVDGLELSRIDKGQITVIKIRVGQITQGPGLPAGIGKYVLYISVLENDCLLYTSPSPRD